MTLRLAFLLVLLTVTTAVVAEDRPAAAKFASVRKERKEFDAKFEEMLREFSKATEERRVELLARYDETAAQEILLNSRLRSAAVAAYAESPNEDDAVTQVLVRAVTHDVICDDYPSALRLGELLLKNNCKDERVCNLVGIAAFSTNDFDRAKKLLNAARKVGSLDDENVIFGSELTSGAYCLELIEKESIAENWKAELAIRAKEARADDLPRVKLETSRGDIVLELFENEAPKTVGNFVHLVEEKFYDGLTFHRVLPAFVAQAGSPDGKHDSGPGYNIPCECYKAGYRKHFAGVLSMAIAGRNTGGSQFFLTFRPMPHLDGKHTVFGRVIEGLDVMQKLQNIDPLSPARNIKPDTIIKASVIRKRDHRYDPTKVE